MARHKVKKDCPNCEAYRDAMNFYRGLAAGMTAAFNELQEARRRGDTMTPQQRRDILAAANRIELAFPNAQDVQDSWYDQTDWLKTLHQRNIDLAARLRKMVEEDSL